MDNGKGQLDNTIQIVTPENIAFRYRVAGPFRRLLAYLLDLVIRVAIFVGAAVLMGIVSWIAGVPGLGIGATLVVLFFVLCFYGGVFETFWNGQTPGKRVLRIRVLSTDGQPINGWQGILRNFLRFIDMQPTGTYLVGLVAAAMNDRFQRLGDLACRTMVVVEEPSWFYGVVRIDEPGAIRLAAQIPARFQTSRSLARALAAYVQRRRYFPWARRMEIARHLGEPLRRQFGLPQGTDLDLLLCGLYHRTFITDRDGQGEVRAGSPFRGTQFMEPQAAFAQFDPAAEVVRAMATSDQGRRRLPG